ncbi:hypothetical protein CB0940_07254 [Cercospora beticola]|uniref:Uncharacterized protein n=1 Tax=Cercospora beticola TaxID=122368 RepID=A0A2G5H9Y0_CERBT|nr:hypothetical protein CB0940_07254 [Cercospora beticola]PIA89042.1 hypothetical protein CB0940_07254 [Cercospora beticola]WPB03187.1 hypothetical protein RHO25_007824 [Cercospora beticola]CAK1358095.1 unnamed protein product [Cercospora beticola]
MPFTNHSLSRALALLCILITSSSAQNCYFPDGSLSKHTSCSATGTASACCASNAFCLDNGLCFEEGVVTRGSCTDRAWKSGACPGYCKEEQRNGSIAITPCSLDGSQSTFTCGLNNTACRNESRTFGLPGSSALVLRPAQVSALVAPVLSSVAAQASASASEQAQATVTSCTGAQAIPSGMYYTPGQMAGLGVGLGIPLLIAACTAIMLWNKERSRHPKLMYQLPDELNMDLKPMPPNMFPAHPAVRSIPPSRDGYPTSRDGIPISRDGFPTSKESYDYAHSFRTVTPTTPIQGRETPQHMQTFAERYQAMNKQMGHSRMSEQSRYELDGQPVGSAFRFTAYGKPLAEKEKTVTATTVELGKRTTTMTTTNSKSSRERTR